MSVQFDSSRQRWVVRWYHDGRQRTRRFADEPAARTFDEQQRNAKAAVRDARSAELAGELGRLVARVETLERRLPADVQARGVSAYATKQGVRWRVAVPRANGRVSTRRGYETHAAALAARARVMDTQSLGADASFARYWREWLAERRPYLTDGALEDLETHGRKRLLPHLAHQRIGHISIVDIRAWMTRMTEQQQAGRLSAKTINNARAALSSALNDALRRGLLLDNPCRWVPPLPVVHHQLDFLRLAEIDPYLRGCPDHYRPLAEVLIGTGARISEALALTWPDIDLDHNSVQIQRQRSRHGATTCQTKGGNARSVLIGPRLTCSLRELHEGRRPVADRPDWLFICPRPTRGRYANRAATSPPSRRTAHEWHHHTLATAGLRAMPLHALRHTAAASWLTTGHSLLFVAHQLGHRNITTTEEHYGHLEYTLLTNTLAATDDAINQAGQHAVNKP